MNRKNVAFRTCLLLSSVFSLAPFSTFTDEPAKELIAKHHGGHSHHGHHRHGHHGHHHHHHHHGSGGSWGIYFGPGFYDGYPNYYYQTPSYYYYNGYPTYYYQTPGYYYDPTTPYYYEGPTFYYESY